MQMLRFDVYPILKVTFQMSEIVASYLEAVWAIATLIFPESSIAKQFDEYHLVDDEQTSPPTHVFFIRSTSKQFSYSTVRLQLARWFARWILAEKNIIFRGNCLRPIATVHHEYIYSNRYEYDIRGACI